MGEKNAYCPPQNVPCQKCLKSPPGCNVTMGVGVCRTFSALMYLTEIFNFHLDICVEMIFFFFFSTLAIVLLM